MTSVYISNENIQAVIGSRSGSRVKISQIACGETGDGCVIGGVITDEAALRDRIASFWDANRLPRSGLDLVVESSSVSTKLLELPNVRGSYLMNLVKESFNEFDAEEAVYDYAVIGAGANGGLKVLAAMTEAGFIRSYVSLFSTARLKLRSIGLAVCGQIRMAQFCKELNSSSYILTVLDKNLVSQFLFIDGEYRFSKRQRVLYDRGTPEFADEIARMISNLIQFKKSENIVSEITDVYLCGASEQEINSVSLIYDGMRIGRLPELSGIACPDKFRGMLSDCVLAAGGLF